MNLFSRISEQYQELWRSIIRPPRDRYKLEDLGPTVFPLGRKTFQRTDMVLVNKRGLRLVCSHFEPVEDQRRVERLPAVIYMHGNCSSRIEALVSLHVLLPQDITVFAFDFSGSGLSGGEYVSLGWYERDDLAVVVEHLRGSGRTSSIGLWGRSMGAVTALLHGDRDPSIGGMVIDSPFCNLRKLAEELVDVYVSWRLPKFLVSSAMSMLRQSILHRAQFDIDLLSPVDHVDKTFIPALFIGAENDKFILPHHAKSLAQKYAGDTNFVEVEGDHNSVRPVFLHDSIAIFFHNTLQCDQLDQKPVKVEALWPMTFSVMSKRHPPKSRKLVSSRADGHGSGTAELRSEARERGERLRMAVERGEDSSTRHCNRESPKQAREWGGDGENEERRSEVLKSASSFLQDREDLIAVPKRKSSRTPFALRSQSATRIFPAHTNTRRHDEHDGRLRRAEDMRPPDPACFFKIDESGVVVLVDAIPDYLQEDEEEAMLQCAIQKSLLSLQTPSTSTNTHTAEATGTMSSAPTINSCCSTFLSSSSSQSQGSSDGLVTPQVLGGASPDANGPSPPSYCLSSRASSAIPTPNSTSCYSSSFSTNTGEVTKSVSLPVLHNRLRGDPAELCGGVSTPPNYFTSISSPSLPSAVSFSIVSRLTADPLSGNGTRTAFLANGDDSTVDPCQRRDC